LTAARACHAGQAREQPIGCEGARGTVVGGFCDARCVRFDHKLSTIKNTYNATVVIQ